MKSNEIRGVLVDPISRRMYGAVLVISDGRIESIREDGSVNGPYIMPGFVDSHVHIESSMVSPVEFSKAAARHGTVAVVADPHEVANVAGIDGVRHMVSSAADAVIKLYFAAPSCVPASPFDECKQPFSAEEIGILLGIPGVVALGEMMNFPGVVTGAKPVMDIIHAANAANVPIDGHAPALVGDDLKKYVGAGISTDHECFTINEARQKISLGMKILIREGSAAKNFDALHPLIESNPDSLMFCTDDCHPDELLRGHINLHVKRALELGYNIYDLLTIATVNPVRHYGLDVGMLQVGDRADFVAVDNLKDFNVIDTFVNGVSMFQNQSNFHSVEIPNYIFPDSFNPNKLNVPVKSDRIRVIGAIDGELVTESLIEGVSTHEVEANPENDILKIAVLSRYTPDLISVGLIKGFGLNYGAIASSVAHDSHHIIAIGCDDQTIASAINFIIKNRGGVCFANQEKVIGLPLPLYGLMSALTVADAAAGYSRVNNAAKEAGSKLTAPFMTMAFMSLSVIPSLKITPKSLFDVDRFTPVDLFV